MITIRKTKRLKLPFHDIFIENLLRCTYIYIHTVYVYIYGPLGNIFSLAVYVT